jgi:hypothetical protein
MSLRRLPKRVHSRRRPWTVRDSSSTRCRPSEISAPIEVVNQEFLNAFSTIPAPSRANWEHIHRLPYLAASCHAHESASGIDSRCSLMASTCFILIANISSSTVMHRISDLAAATLHMISTLSQPWIVCCMAISRASYQGGFTSLQSRTLRAI